MSISKNSKVSIVIPVFNRENLILETVQSALSQDYLNLEVIVVDNNSTDNTYKCLKSISDKRLMVFQNSENIGPVRNWKKAIEYANGEFVKILWSDDLLEKSCINELLEGFDNETAFSYSTTKIFNNTTSKLRYKLSDSKKIESRRYLEHLIHSITDLPVSPGCALFRKSDLQENLEVQITNQLGIDYSTLAIGNDLLLFLKPLLKYKYVNYVSNTLCSFREHEDSISNKSGSEILDFHYSYCKLYFLNRYYGKGILLYSFLINFGYKFLIKKRKYPFNEFSFFKTLPHKNICDLLLSPLSLCYVIYLKTFKKGSL
jgi:glycosyltransferase involved in cell wall biosynthesis